MEAQEYELSSDENIKLIDEIKKRGRFSPLLLLILDIIGNGGARDCAHAQALVCAASS